MSEEKDIYQQGQNFAYDTVERMKNDVLFSRLLMFISLFIAILSLAAFLYLLPLKQTVFVPIKVDNDTGQMEVLSTLEESAHYTKDKALTAGFFYTFLLAREGYHASAIQHNYDTVRVYTDEQALEDFIFLWEENNKNNPGQLYGWDYRYDVVVKEILIEDSNSIYTRFSRVKRKGAEVIETKHYAATVRFKYTKEPTKVGDRLKNPLGFKVTHYDPTEISDIQ